MSTERFLRYRHDPDAYAAEVARFHLYSKQREILRAIQEHPKTTVAAGNAVGKSFVVAFAIHHHLAGGPGSVVVATSATDGQLKRVLWREERRQFPAHFFGGATVTESEIRLDDDWFAVAFSTDVPEALQGIHADRVLVVVDEASGVDEAMFDAIEGLMAGGDARLLLVGNPLRTSGTFYDSFNSRRDEFHQITISAYDTPAFTGERAPREVRRRLVSKRWVERLEKQHAGTNTFLVKVLGEFPKQADDTVVARGDLDAALAQTLDSGLPVVIGVDVARFGSDETVVAVREGNVVRVVDGWNGRDLMDTTGRVIDRAKQLQAEQARRVRIVVDDAGVGGGVTDRLREQGYEVVAFNGGGRARHPRDYPNRRSELWFECAEVLPLLDLDPADEELARELLAPTYSFDSSGARVVEQKANTRKRLRRSPDRADAALLTLAVDPPRAPGRRRSAPTVLVPRGTIPEPAVADLGRRPFPLLILDRLLDRSVKVEKTPPPPMNGGFVYQPRGAPTGAGTPPVGLESRGALLSWATRGIRPKTPPGTGESRTLCRGLHVPATTSPASLEEISAAVGLPVYDRNAALGAHDALIARGRRSAGGSEPALDPLAGLGYDAQSELDGYLGAGL